MKKLFTNAKQEPRIFYCKHIAPGVCGYQDETILIGEDCLKKMDPTFAGKPVYVDHQRVDLDNIQQEAAGYVAESFYLPEDGNHWAKIIIVSDEGHEAVSKGWAVSNAYIPDSFGAGGEWHNIPYNREVESAHYTHLALVSNPRYEEAEIMTPEEFKLYKESKREQLKELSNSKEKKGEKKMAWKLFTKKEVTNSEDLENAMVELSDGSAVSIKEMVNAVEEEKKEEEKKSKKNACNDLLEETVKVNGEDMKVGELVEHFEKKAKKNAEDEEKKKEEEKASKKNAEEETDKNKLKNEIMRAVNTLLKGKGEVEGKSEEEWYKEFRENLDKLAYTESTADRSNKKNADEEEEEAKKNSKTYKEMLNAEFTNSLDMSVVVDTVAMKVARGNARYGSSK